MTCGDDGRGKGPAATTTTETTMTDIHPQPTEDEARQEAAKALQDALDRRDNGGRTPR